MNELKLADLGEGMHEAEIVEWLVQEGETVKLDQPVVRVETDKAIVEIPSPVAGRVSEVRFEPGQMVKVGEVLVVYGPAKASNGHGKNAHAPSAAASTQATPTQPASTPPRVMAAPAVRKLAFELGIDLTQVTPSANGRVSMDDVRAHAERAKAVEPAPKPDEPASDLASQIPNTPSHTPSKSTPGDVRKVLVGLRKRVAEHMERSWRLIPHATAFDELDASGLIALRQTLLPVAEQRNTRLTYMPLLIKLLIPVLKEFTIFNASLDEEKREIIYKRSFHIGVAAASPEGLLVPVLRDADKLSVMEIAKRLELLIEGAKKRTLAPHELNGSTFTLNNVGSFGGSSGTPIINHPEVAILVVGKIEEKVIVRHGAMLIQPRMPLTLAFDHRLIDGALAGTFMDRFKELVENPQQLLLDLI
ncbi:MAG: dihydrolipoamide acetyltransferase family protein [Ktedonobacteraceae bacterium]